MIFTVATIRPGSTTANSWRVAMVIAGSIRLKRSTRARSMTSSPAASAYRLDRPVKGGSTRMPTPAADRARRPAASSSCTSPGSRRAATTSPTPAACSAAISGAPSSVPFLKTPPPWRTEWARIVPSAMPTGTLPNFTPRPQSRQCPGCATLKSPGQGSQRRSPPVTARVSQGRWEQRCGRARRRRAPRP